MGIVLLLSRRCRQTLQAGLGEEVWLKETLRGFFRGLVLVKGMGSIWVLFFCKKNSTYLILQEEVGVKLLQSGGQLLTIV